MNVLSSILRLGFVVTLFYESGVFTANSTMIRRRNMETEKIQNEKNQDRNLVGHSTIPEHDPKLVPVHDTPSPTKQPVAPPNPWPTLTQPTPMYKPPTGDDGTFYPPAFYNPPKPAPPPVHQPPAYAVPTPYPTFKAPVTPDPTPVPTFPSPSSIPSDLPSLMPTLTSSPSKSPSVSPTDAPTTEPSDGPTTAPSVEPTNSPTLNPSVSPTNEPTVEPTTNPSEEPSYNPSVEPSALPTTEPSEYPSPEPSAPPTTATQPPSSAPSNVPTRSPEPTMTEEPTEEPTVSEEPSEVPTESPEPTTSEEPSEEPTFSEMPSDSPTISPQPTSSEQPSSSLTFTKHPSSAPSVSLAPSGAPSVSAAPTNTPRVLVPLPFEAVHVIDTVMQLTPEQISQIVLFTNTFLKESFLVRFDNDPLVDFITVDTLFLALDFDPPVGRQETMEVGLAYVSSFYFSTVSNTTVIPSQRELLREVALLLESDIYISALGFLAPNPFSTTETVRVVGRPMGNTTATVPEEEVEEEGRTDHSEVNVPGATADGDTLSAAPSEFSAPVAPMPTGDSDALSASPSAVPSDSPSMVPTDRLTETTSPSSSPSAIPSDYPSLSPSAIPSDMPSLSPSAAPSAIPSDMPSLSPSTAPSVSPSAIPSDLPSSAPSVAPSEAPTAKGKDTLSASPTAIDFALEPEVECKLCSFEICVVKRKGRMAAFPGVEEEPCIEVLMRLQGEMLTPSQCEELQQEFEAECLLMNDTITSAPETNSTDVSEFPSDFPSLSPTASS